MKTLHKKTFFLFILTFIFLYSCKVSDIFNAANTEFYIISCKVDGSSWVPGIKGNATPRGAISSGSVKEKYIYFSGFRVEVPLLNPNSAVEDEFFVSLSNINKIGTYKIGVYGIDASANFNRHSYDNKVDERYESTKDFGGEIIITALDFTKKFMEGTFSCTLVDIKTLKTIKLTNGKFSISSN